MFRTALLSLKTKMKIKNHRQIIGIALMIGVFSVGVLATPFSINKPVGATSISDLQAQTSRLEAQINASNSQANNLQRKGDSLKAAIADFDWRIAQMVRRIELTEKKIELLKRQQEKARKELERQKGLLRANVQALYKRGNASQVEMIVGSDNFAHYINSQEYLERIKQGIQTSAQKIVELKKRLAAQKKQQEQLLIEQKTTKASLNNARNKRANLLRITKGRESRYRTHSAQLEKQRQQILAEIVARSQVISGVGTGSYPWANYRAGSWSHYMSCEYGDDIDPWGYCYRQCVSFVAWRIYSTGRTPPKYLGNAENWPINSYQPKVGAVAIWNNFGLGHVAYVEEVYGDGRVRISEYNASPPYGGTYSQRIISAGDPSGYGYY